MIKTKANTATRKRTLDAVASEPRPPLASQFDAGFQLAEVTRLMRAAFDQRMRAIGLTSATWRVLVYLGRSDGRTQIDLARQLEVSRVSLGQMIDRLEASGHVERRSDASDRRVWRVHLTKKSHEIVPDMIATARALQEEAFAEFNPEEIATLRRMLGRLRNRLLSMKIDDAAFDEEARE